KDHDVGYVLLDDVTVALVHHDLVVAMQDVVRADDGRQLGQERCLQRRRCGDGHRFGGSTLIEEASESSWATRSCPKVWHFTRIRGPCPFGPARARVDDEVMTPGR